MNIAASHEESGLDMDHVDSSYSSALTCAQSAGQARLQVRYII